MQHISRSHPMLPLILALAACDAPARAPTPAAPTPAAAAGAEELAAARLTGGEGRAARWQDTTVLLDGKPIGMLAFGELPIGLAPVWIEEEVSVPVKPGQRGPGFRRVKGRQYRFADYLRALGVDVARIKELHVHGPKPTEALIVRGPELAQNRDGLRFRFGAEVAGKAIPVVADDLGNGRSPDKISRVAVYVERTPPTLVRNVGFVLDGKPVLGIPYATEMARGGVHVYLDDRLATVIKRRRLGADAAPAAMDGSARRPLLELLAADGVDTRRVVELWIIRDERRAERLGRADLEDATFALGAQGRATIQRGDDELAVGALALHSRSLRPSELPTILPEEDDASTLATP
jgi:hypothetical protein